MLIIFGDEDLIFVSLLVFYDKNANILHITLKKKRKLNVRER